MKGIQNKMRNRILVLVLPVVLLMLALLSYSSYVIMRDSLARDYEESRQATEQHITDAVTLIDAAYRMLEVRLEAELQQPLEAYRGAYEASGGILSQEAMEALKKRYGNSFDFIVIDSRTIITAATTPKAIGFSFTAFDPELGKKIDAIRQGDEIWYEQVRTNVSTGRLSKFAYIPVSDHSVLLEIGYSVNGFDRLIEELKPQNLTEKLVGISPLVASVRMFDAYGYQVVDSGENYEPTAEILKALARAKTEGSFEEYPGEDTVIKYLYLDLNGKRERTLASTDRLIEITYNVETIHQRLNQLAKTSLLVSVGVLLLLVVSVILLVRRLTRPIEVLKQTADEIAKGNYEVRARVDCSDEVRDLAESFNQMLDVVNNSYGEIERQRNELEDYSRTLEEKVADRTRELADRNRQLDDQRQLLEQIAMQDGLTGIPNRRSFTERFMYEWERCIRDEVPLSLMIIDVDSFKKYNDTYGHAMGDTVLKTVAAAVVASVRRASDFAGRIGGEEFAVLLPETDAEGARQLAEEIRSRVQELCIPHEFSPVDVLTISIGGATDAPQPGSDRQQFFETADRMLYQAKAEGKNKVQWK